MTTLGKQIFKWLLIAALAAILIVGLFWGWEALTILGVYLILLALVAAMVSLGFSRLTGRARRTIRKR